MSDYEHLVERAAARMRRSGALDPSAAALLSPGPGEMSAPDAIPAAVPGAPDYAATALAGHPPADADAVTPDRIAGDTAMPPPAEAAESKPAPSSPLPSPPPGRGGSRLFRPRPERLAPSPAPDATPTTRLPSEPGTIPIEVLTGAGMIDRSAARTWVSEELRLVQSQILRQAFDTQQTEPGSPPPNLVMITSACPGEGKSFTALNLAVSIARQRDRDVLLIDVDSKHHSIGQTLGLVSQPGLLNLALDPSLDPLRVIKPTAIDRLCVLPIGFPVERSAEVFSSRAMMRTVRNLARRFSDRILILDAAPCLSTSDPSMLAQVVGQLVMLVEAERTQRAEVEASLDLVQACPVIMMLLNKVQAVERHSFGGYGKSYGYYGQR